jgi:hypothetical protein
MNRGPAISILLLLLAGRAAAASWGPPEDRPVYSQSGQFVVTGRALAPAAAQTFRFDENFKRFIGSGWTQGDRPLARGMAATNAGTLLLDPSYLVATAERVRFVFNDVLKLTEPYRGKIYINLLEAADPAAEITFVASYDPQKRTWNSQIGMPAEIAPERLVRVLVQTLIFEAAQRGAGPAGCEIPLWLSEGLIAHLTARTAKAAVFEPHQPVNVFQSPVEEARQLAEQITPGACLTLEQLSWPGLLERKPEVERAYQLTAHAFTLELLGLKEGGRCLGQVIRNLPHFQNWQFAFLKGFERHFPSLLDAEKWWAINSLHLGGRGAHEKWTFAETLRRLDAALVVPVQWRAAEDSELVREEIDLATLITSMEFTRQQSLLARVISGLFNLELRAAPRAAPLVADYRLALEKYVTDRELARRQETDRPRLARRQQMAAQAALQQLEALATLRRDLELLEPAEAAPADASPALSAAAR